MKKTGLTAISLLIAFFLLINGLIIIIAYRALFAFFAGTATTEYLRIATDILSVLLAFLVTFTAVIIMLERRDPSRTLAWLLIIIFLPILGVILYLTLGRQFRKRRMTAKKRRLNDCLYPFSEGFVPAPDELSPVPQSKERLMQLILNNTEFPVTLYNDLMVLTDGEQIFSAMIEALEEAKEYIFLETYILRSDGIGSRIAEILVKKAQQGVKVRVIYDGLGSRDLNETYLDSLRRVGIKIEPFFPVRLPYLHNRINYRNHRKILVIDGTTGFLGGANIGDEYLDVEKWRDTHLRIRGNAVCFLQRIFMQDWYFITKEKLEEQLPAPRPDKPGNTIVQITAGGPDTHWEAIMQLYYYAIATADKSVYLTSPYFIPNESILTALKTIALSGVDVKILLPAKPDHKMLYWAAMSYLEELMEAGVEIYLYQKAFIHAKVLTIDEVVSVIGSANMDQRSFSINFEVNALIYDEATTKRLNSDFFTDLQNSQKVSLDSFKERPFPKRFLESAIRLLSPLL